MTLKERLEKLCLENGAELEDDEESQIWRVWSRDQRNLWIESGACVLAEGYGNACQSWKPDAFKSLRESIELGHFKEG